MTTAGLFSRVRGLFSPPKISADDSNNFATVGGGYDGAQSSAARTSFFSFPIWPRLEISPFSRREILRKVRALEANLGLIARMKSQVGKYAVGFGVFPTPQTSDTAWNDKARTLFMDWANNPGVSDTAGAMTYWERQRYHVETTFAEGESFDVMVSSSVSGSPQLQLFDNSEVGHTFGNYTDKVTGFTWYDGVRANENGRALGYLVQGGNFYFAAEPVEIAAADMIHLMRHKRAGQLRGLSPFAPGINSAIDQLDLRALTTAAAKLHEALGIVVKKQSGEAGKTGVTNQLTKILGPDGELTRVNEKFLQGAGIQYLGLDEEIEIVGSNRPTQNLVNWYIELVRDVCLGTGLNFEIVFSLMELGGAPARIVLADAQWFFDSEQDRLNDRFNQRVWVWWCASMMKNGQLPVCRDPRWWNCHWQGPAKLTADAGRTAAAEIEFLRNGFTNWTDHYSTRGRDWKDPIQRRIEELAWAKTQCAQAGIPFELLFPPQPGAAPVSANTRDGGTGAISDSGGASANGRKRRIKLLRDKDGNATGAIAEEISEEKEFTLGSQASLPDSADSASSLSL
jgi:capsid protein